MRAANPRTTLSCLWSGGAGMNNLPLKPPFDVIRATFYLVAFVFGLYGLVTLVAIGVCAWQLQALSAAGRMCIKEGGVGEALMTLLASALAFAAGRTHTKE